MTARPIGPRHIPVINPISNEIQHIQEFRDRVLGARLPANCVREVIAIDDGSCEALVK